MLCGYDPCPLLQKVRSQMPKIVREGGKLGRDLFGSSPPSLFVGRHGYPHVTVGPMLPPEHREEGDARRLDAPLEWLDLSIPDIVGLRSSLLRTTHRVRVDRAAGPVGDVFSPDRITRLSQELALTARPVDTEVHLARAPRFEAPSVGDFAPPHGPTAQVERAELAENVRVERPVERAANDTDLRAGEALASLYDSGTSVYHLERVLSAGMLGLGDKRKLVPTRWAITATDDQVGQALIERLRGLPTIDKPMVHFGERFGNRFLILLMPRVWGYDSIEGWLKGSFWATAGGGAFGQGSIPQGPADGSIVEADWEDHTGRTTYAATAGGYYATRIAVLEHLVKLGRQATAIALREITDEYTTPLGVWVVREASRIAMAARPLVFEDLASALRHMDRHALYKPWQAHAHLLKRVRTQRALEDY